MPLVDVAIVLRPQESLRATLARELADRIGEALGASPGSTWVTVREIAADRYGENRVGSTAEVAPVFVTVPLTTTQLRCELAVVPPTPRLVIRTNPLLMTRPSAPMARNELA